MTHAPRDPAATLWGWLNEEPGKPRLTQRFADGARIELSGATLANAAAKAANLFAGDLGIGAGDIVDVRLGQHWQAAPVVLGAWWSGATVRLTSPASAPLSEVVLTGPAGRACLAEDDIATRAPTVLAVSEHPWGLPLGPATPAGSEDFAAMARVQPDAALQVDPPPAESAWLVTQSQTLTGHALMVRAAQYTHQWSVPVAATLATDTAPDCIEGLAALMLVPAAVGGSSLLIPPGLPDSDREHILGEEGTKAVTFDVR